MRVEIHDIENDLDHLAGTLRLQDGRIVAEPDTLTMRNIIAEPVLDWDAGANYWSGEQPEKFLRALHLQYRSPYLRASKVLEDGKGEPVTKSRQSRRGETGDGGAALADHYADTWNALHGPDVPDEELQAASEELAGGPQRVTLRPDGSWVAHRFDDPKPLRAWKNYEPAVVKEAEHAPPGGVFLVNMQGEAKFYKGGQWIPAKDIANLPPDQKAKLDAAVQQAKMNRVQSGHVNPNELQKQLEPHARQLSNDEQVRAVNEARALHNYHGDLTLHRIEQLAKQQQGFLKRQNLTDKQRKQIEGNLARLHAMVPLAQSWGVTGQVPRELQERALAKTANKAPGAPRERGQQDGGKAQTLEQSLEKMKENAAKYKGVSDEDIADQIRKSLTLKNGYVNMGFGDPSGELNDKEIAKVSRFRMIARDQFGFDLAKPEVDKKSHVLKCRIIPLRMPQQDNPPAAQAGAAEKEPKFTPEQQANLGKLKEALAQTEAEALNIEKPSEPRAAGKKVESTQPENAKPSTPQAETIPVTSENHPANPNAEGFLHVDRFYEMPQFKGADDEVDTARADAALGEIVRRHQQGGGKVEFEGEGLRFLPPDKEEKPATDSAHLAQEKPAARTEAPLSPEDAAKALARQAGHEAQPKEGADAASDLNRQLIEEGKEKPKEEAKPAVEAKPEPKSPEETAFESAWNKALAENPLAQWARAAGKLEEARERVLTDLVSEGVSIPKRVTEQYRDVYDRAVQAAKQRQEEKASQREKQSRGTPTEVRAYWSDKAAKEGIGPEHLHAAADEILKEDEGHVEDRRRLLKDARDLLAHYGYNAQALTTNLRSGRVEDRIPGIDLVARTLKNRYPGQFATSKGREYDDLPEYRLQEMFEEGVPKPLTKEEAYEKALDYLREQKEHERDLEKRRAEYEEPSAEREPGADEEDEASPSSDWLDDEEDDPFAFGANKWKSLRAWIQKGRRRVDAPGQMHLFDTSKHPHAPAGSPQGGQFVSTHHPQKIQNAQDRYANRGRTAQGGGLFGGEDLQARRGFAKLPDGAPIVFTAGEFEGQTGKIVRDVDTQTGAPRIVATVDGRPGLVPVSPDSIEPLDVRHSWRIEGGGTGREEKQGGLYSAEHFLPKR